MVTDKDLFLDYLKRNPPLDKDRSPQARIKQNSIKTASQNYDKVLDLHGMERARALEMLLDTIAMAKRSGMKRILVIHGRGIHSVDGQRGVLKDVTKTCLDSLIGKGISGYNGAPSKDGGEGATVVRIS